MTARQPSRRLVDVLRQNSKKTLERHAVELAAAATSLPAEAIQTRFLRNQFLINPKSLQLLVSEEQLSRWHVFGIYKPPFCPMRRSEAQDNYHHVSVESFVESALRSKVVYPTVQRVLKPSEVRVRVLYNLDSFASGPVLVSLSDKFHFSTSLQTTTMEYDVLVSGHLPVHATGNHTSIEMRHLFPDAAFGRSATETSSSRSTDAPITAPEGKKSKVDSGAAYYEVKENGYYSVHPVSLLHVVLRCPPTPQPPALEKFAREQLATCVMGDPRVMGELMQLREYAPKSASSASASQTHQRSKEHVCAEDPAGDCKPAATTRDVAAHAAAVKLAANPHIVSMRGDCDFPRVFMHLREVKVDTRGEAAASMGDDVEESLQAATPAGAFAFNLPQQGLTPEQRQQRDELAHLSGIELHCRKCFDGLVQKQLSASFKSRRISLLDGTWTPHSEHL